MERVSTGERTAADQLMVSDCSPDRALTERILEVADEAGYRAALIDATDGSVTAWPRFARTVRAAAAGLARRGLAEGDTAGVFVQDAASAAIAVNAIRAAGGGRLPDPVRRGPGGYRRPAQRLRGAGADHLGSAGRARRRGRGPFPGAAGHRVRGRGRHHPVQLAARIGPANSQPDAQAAAEPGFAESPVPRMSLAVRRGTARLMSET